MSRIEQACPVLPAADPAQTAAWYCDRLGFSLALDDREHHYAIVQRDGVELHFWKSDDKTLAENSSAYLRVHNIEALHQSMEKASEGGRITEIQDREWGMREFYVIDPNGNLLRFGVHL